jgi:hypothetical protein
MVSRERFSSTSSDSRVTNFYGPNAIGTLLFYRMGVQEKSEDETIVDVLVLAWRNE